MFYSLPIAPEEDESVSSFIMRSAIELLTTPKEFRKELGLFSEYPGGGFIFNDLDWPEGYDLCELERRLNLKRGQIKDMIAWKQNYSLAKHFINSSYRSLFWRKNSTRICPACLRESLHWKISWKNNLILECSKHQTELISRCPKCSAKINTTAYTTMSSTIFSTYLNAGNSVLATCLNCGYDFRKTHQSVQLRLCL